jgi:hypothetical protein
LNAIVGKIGPRTPPGSALISSSLPLLDTSPRASSRPIYWQKNLILEQPQLTKYEQVAWIDSDIVINAEEAPSIFDKVPEERIGAVDEYRVPDAATYRKALAATYLRARRLGQPFLHNLTPQEYYRMRGFPTFDEVVQGGVIVSSPRHHREVFRAVYNYDDPGIPLIQLRNGSLVLRNTQPQSRDVAGLSLQSVGSSRCSRASP